MNTGLLFSPSLVLAFLKQEQCCIRTTRASAASESEPSKDPARPTKGPGGTAKVDEKYSEGDFVINAKDGVVLRLPSFYMLAAR